MQYSRSNFSLKTQTPQQRLKTELKAVNLSWPSVRDFLPDWHEDALGSEAGLLELKSFISKNFGLLIGPDGILTFGKPAPAKFKTMANTDIAEVQAARATATACARIVAKAVKTKPQKRNWSIQDPLKFREFALTFEDQQRWVDFEALVKACWAINILVLYLPEIGKLGKKMDGMVTYLSGRFIVVLTKKAAPDWLVFILAHELGHIGKGHLVETEGLAIIDKEVKENSDYDEEESQANAYAISLLTQGKILRLEGLMPAPQFADTAIAYGKEHKISPGHVILNAAKHTIKDGKPVYPLANAALNLLSEDIAGPQVEVACRNSLLEHVDLDQINSTNYEFLEKMKVL